MEQLRPDVACFDDGLLRRSQSEASIASLAHPAAQRVIARTELAQVAAIAGIVKGT
jgi:hypothetical protein